MGTPLQYMLADFTSWWTVGYHNGYNRMKCSPPAGPTATNKDKIAYREGWDEGWAERLVHDTICGRSNA